MTAPKRREEHASDPWLRTVDKFRNRGWDLCDCPCHGHRGIREAVPCCRMAGLRYIARENAYIPWNNGQEQP